MKILKEMHPLVAQWIEESKPVNWIEPVMSGQINNLLIKAQGVTKPVYDPRAPKKDAKNLSRAIVRHSNNISVLIGFGCGYTLKEILNKLKDDKHKIIMVETVPDFYKHAFTHNNFVKAIKNNQVFFATCQNDFTAIASMLENTHMLENWLLHIDEYTKMKHEYFDIKEYATSFICQLRCNTDTVAAAGKRIADNDMLTLPYVIKHRGVSELKNLYEGKPAIICCTGPSLAKNIHLLLEEDVQRKFIIIAVGQCLRILLAYGITPDFICSVDYGEVNYGHYKDLMDTDVPLVALNRSYAPLLKNWKGTKFITVTPNPGVEGTATSLLQEKGGLEQGGSVAHMAYGLANFMGCSPIALTGQDLAYDGDKSHIELVDEGGDVEINENGEIKWNVVDPNSTIKGEHSMGGVTYVMGYFGKAVTTNVGLQSFITSFEYLFNNSDKKIINATEGGARIRNCEQMSLKKVIDDYGKEDIDKSVIKPLLSPIEDSEERMDEAVKILGSDLKNLKEIVKQAGKALSIGKKLQKKKLKKSEKFELLAESFKATKRANELSVKNPLVNLAIFKEQKSIHHRNYMVEADTDHLVSKRGEKDLRIRLTRNALILQAALDASKSLIESYDETLMIIQNAIKDPSIVEPEKEALPSMDNADESLERGNWARVLTDCIKIKRADEESGEWGVSEIMDKVLKYMPKAVRMRAEAINKAKSEYYPVEVDKIILYNKLVEDASKLGRDKKDFKGACEKLEEALAVYPDKIEAKWGLASTYHILDDLDKSIKLYEELIELKDNPNILPFKFEYGIVLMKDSRLAEASKIFADVMENTNAYNYFYKQLGQLYFSVGMRKEALTAFDEYLKFYPADYEAWLAKANCLKRLGKAKQAEKCFDRANRMKK